MLKFDTRFLEFEIDGKVKRISYPSVDELTKFTKKAKESDDEIGNIKDFLAVLGLDKKDSGKLEVYALNKIIQELTKEKK